MPKYVRRFGQSSQLFENSRKLAIQNYVYRGSNAEVPEGQISTQVFKDLQELDPSHTEMDGKAIGGKYI